VKVSVAWFLVFLALSACVSTGPLVPKTSTKVGESPRLNEVVEKSVGEVIYETYNYQEFEGVKLTEPADVDVLAARWSLPPHEPLQAYVEGPAKIYCTRDLALRRGALRLISRPGSGASWGRRVGDREGL
jgi:hypothetical protein